jgi:excisionase family DNA binding protein
MALDEGGRGVSVDRESERLLRTLVSQMVLLREDFERLESKLDATREDTHAPEAIWVGLSDAATRLGVSVKTLRKLIASGEVRAQRPEGANVVRISRAELARLAGESDRDAATA